MPSKRSKINPQRASQHKRLIRDDYTRRVAPGLWQDPEALRAMQDSINDLKKGRMLKLSGGPKIRRILAAARKKGLLRG